MSNRNWIILIFCAGLLILLPGMFQLPLMDRDEPRFSRAAVEMMERNDWAVPWFNGNFRFDKPPLTYWLMMPFLAMDGESEAAVRIPTLLSTLTCAWLIFSFGKRLGYTSSRAALAAMGWLTCLQVLIHGRTAVADMHLIVMLIVSMRSMWELAVEERSDVFWNRKWFHVLWMSMGLGFLAKGPLALVVPLVALLCSFLLERIGSREGKVYAAKLLRFWALALLPALALIALWGIPALVATKGLFYDVGIGTHVVDRGLAGFNQRKTIPVIYYFLVMPIFFAPWTGGLADAMSAMRGNRMNERYLAAWVMSPLLIFSGYATQLPHYILPAYPALCLLLAGAWNRGSKKWKAILSGIPSTFFLVLSVAACWGAWQARAFDASLSHMLIGLVVFTLSLSVASICFGLSRLFAGFAAMTVAIVGYQWLAIYAAKAHVVKRLVNAAGTPFSSPASIGYSEPSLVWYGSTTWTFASEYPEAADFHVLLGRRWRADGKTLAAIWQGKSPEPTRVADEAAMKLVPAHAATVQGWSAADSSWVELLYWRDSPKED
jgi:4-amino-4-deoxy-L-arabinose transferase-like glycosyltransferase